MKLAFSQAVREPGVIDQLLTGFCAAGFDGLQLKTNQYADWLSRPQAFRERYPLAGVASALIVGCGLDEAGCARLRQIFAFGKAVGAERVIFCHGHPREGVTPSDLERFARILSRLGEEALDQGLRLSLHHHYNNPVMHRADFDIFFGAITPGAVGLTLDTAHAVKSGIADVAELIRGLAHVIDNYHLKDYARGEWRVLGQGEIDFAPIFAALRDTGYNGWVSTDEESGADLHPAMKTCLAFMVQGMERAVTAR